jgi:transposase-like protein
MTKKKQSTESAVRDIRRRTRRKFSPEEKIRIVLEGLRVYVVEVLRTRAALSKETVFEDLRRLETGASLGATAPSSELIPSQNQTVGPPVRFPPPPPILL